jgi:hypothetical protein
MEDDDRWGRSRYANLEGEWAKYVELCKRRGNYIKLVCTPVPMIKYPEGFEGRDRGGMKRSGFELAEGLAKKLVGGDPICMPNQLDQLAREVIKQGGDPNKLMAWQIEFLEARGQHGAELVAMANHMESLMFRGMLVPERTALEGTHGTKAEAGEHADVATSVAQLLLNEVIRNVNRYLVNPLVAYNFGEQYIDTVMVDTPSLEDATKATVADILVNVLKTPQGAARYMDMDAAMDMIGIPKAEEIIPPGGVDDRGLDLAPDEDEDELRDEPPPEAIAASLLLMARRRPAA